MFIKEDTKETILKRAEGKLQDIIADFTTLKKDGTSGLKGKCPLCKNENSLKINVGKQIFKCFKCDFGGNNAVTYLMTGHNKPYPDTLKYLADHFNVFIDEPIAAPRNSKPSKLNGKTTSYCETALAEVGLTQDDVTAKIKRDNKFINHPTFRSGTMDQFGRVTAGDDMIIEYFDLDGKEVTYLKKGSNKEEPFYRIRWQNPSLHLDASGNPYKYHSPKGGGTHLYIPQAIRSAYKVGKKIKTLFIQEGEKKAEKCCKHGIMSVGISGIHCIANNNALPSAFQQLIQKCEIENIILLFDSDWDEISSNIRTGDNVDKRPRTFMQAAINYKNYFRGFFPQGIFFEIYFGHVQKGSEKGIDDLLAGKLKGHENKLNEEVERLLNEKEPVGDLVRLYRVTTWTSEYKFEQIWSLHSAQEFAERYQATLENLPEFTIGKHRWRFREGKFESAQPVENDEQYWQIEEWEDKTGRTRRQETFDYANCYNFLKNRGFGRIAMRTADFSFAKMNSKIIYPQEPWQIRDFVTDFTKQVAPKSALNMIYRGGPQYLGPDKLSNLEFVFPNYYQPDKESQYLYFSKSAWKITATSIEEMSINDIDHQVWAENVMPFDAKKVSEPLIEVERITDELLHKMSRENQETYANHVGSFLYDISKTGKKCHFLQFLVNASNFTWRKDDSDITLEDNIENAHHLIAKLCAIGFLLHSYKNKSITKAVIGMDGKQSEVGVSNGRSGKSLVGNAIAEVIHQCYIPGKTKNLTDDAFIFDGVTEKHKNIFIDDVRTNFDFEFLFPPITGNMMVNKKGDKRFSIPFENSPKFYITTNHALNGDGSSFRDRQWLVAFSDFYNDQHKPVDDFGVPFFDEWDWNQRNLFYNLMATCVQLWLKFGIIESPDERLEQRRLRQQIGEDFITWADEYFSKSERLNQQIARKELYDDFMDNFPTQRKYITASRFKNKILHYCEFRNYKFNPHKYDPSTGLPLFFDKDGKPSIDDKTGGKEYFTIGDQEFDKVEEQIF